MIFIDGSNLYHSLKNHFNRTDLDIGNIDEGPPTCDQRKGRSGGPPSEKADYPHAPNNRRRLRARILRYSAHLERP